MKKIILALAIGLTAMGCSRLGKGEVEEHILKSQGYVTKTFCGDVINIIDENDNKKYTIKPINLPKEMVQTLSIYDKSTLKVDVSYIVTKDEEVTCPGFFSYKQEVKIINIKKID